MDISNFPLRKPFTFNVKTVIFDLKLKNDRILLAVGGVLKVVSFKNHNVVQSVPPVVVRTEVVLQYVLTNSIHTGTDWLTDFHMIDS